MENKLIRSAEFLDIITHWIWTLKGIIDWYLSPPTVEERFFYQVKDINRLLCLELSPVMRVLLDFAKETVTTLKIEYIAIRIDVFWTQDSNLLEISLHSMTLLFNCKTACGNAIGGTRTRETDLRIDGHLVALRWVSLDNYEEFMLFHKICAWKLNSWNLFCVIEFIAGYDVSFEQKRVIFVRIHLWIQGLPTILHLQLVLIGSTIDFSRFGLRTILMFQGMPTLFLSKSLGFHRRRTRYLLPCCKFVPSTRAIAIAYRSYLFNSILTWMLFDSLTKSSMVQRTRAVHSLRAFQMRPVPFHPFRLFKSISKCPNFVFLDY